MTPAVVLPVDRLISTDQPAAVVASVIAGDFPMVLFIINKRIILGVGYESCNHSWITLCGIFQRRRKVKKLLLAGTTVLLMATSAHAQRECGNYACSFLGHPSTWTQPYGQPRPGVRPIRTPKYTASQMRNRQMLERDCARTGCY